MSVSVGGISLDMMLNSAQFKKQINGIQTQANSVSTKISGSFKKVGVAIASAFSVAVIKNFGQKCIESSASVQAANSQFAQTFGDMQEQASAAMKAVADESKITQSRLQGVGTSIYAFAKTTGMESSQALTMMQDALKVTADSAAYYDRSLEDTSESLKSFLKGNFENDAALGLSCTETTRNTAANKLYGKSFKDLSESQKQLTLLQMVKDANKLSGALGQASRESDGWENVLGNLKETWNQFLAIIGKPILQGAVVVVKNITSALSTLTEHARNAINSLSELFGWDTSSVSSDLSSTASSVGSIASEADSSSESLDNVANSAEKAKGSVAGFDKLNVLSKNDSSSSSDGASTDLSSGIVNSSVSNTVDTTSKKFSNAFKNFYEESGFKGFVEKVQKGIEKVDWSSIKDNCQSIMKNAIPIAQASISSVQQIGVSALDAYGSAVGGFTMVSGKQIQTLTGGIAKWLDKDKSKINSFINDFTSSFKNGFSNLSTFFDGWFGLLGDSVDRMRPKIETAISDLLSGFTNFGISVGTVVSGGFEIATESLSKWIEKDGEEISTFFDNMQIMLADVMTLVGDIFGDIGTTVLDWWNGEGGSSVFSNICDMFTNIGTTFMNVWNDWIKPAWDFIVGVVQSAWDNWLKPVFESALSLFGKLCEAVSTVWNNFLSPLVNWIVDFFGPMFTNVFNAIKGIFDTVFTFIGDLVSGLWKSLGGLCDFVTGVFSGDWEKAWNGIKDFFKGIWDGIWAIVKGVINYIIDGINLLWTGVYNVVSGIINGIGGIAGALGDLFGQDWHFEMPESPPLIPKLAKGGIVKAPTLAVVGDNAGANTGDPEVISPLSKLQGMINTSSGQDVVILAQILDYLKRIYEMFVVFRNNGGNYYEFIAKLNGSEIFDEVVKQNELYKKRHNGKSAFS